MDCAAAVAAAAAEDGQFVRGLRNEQVRMRRKEAKGRTRHEERGDRLLCRCVFVGNENSAFVAPPSFSPHFVASDIVCRICLPFAPESERRLPHVCSPSSGGNPAETKVKQEEHHGRAESGEGGISQGRETFRSGRRRGWQKTAKG